MKIIFDTNVWVALFNEKDGHHDAAQRLFLQNGMVFIPEYVILETTTVLQLRASKQQADIFAETITATEQLEILYASDSFFRSVLTLFQQQSSTKLSFVDCALLLLSEHYKIHTFDEALEKAIYSNINSRNSDLDKKC
jgi:predicted nucleic acid-binding protein